MALRRFDLEAGGDTFAFRPETEEKIAFWRAKYPAEKQRSAVIPLLWLAQKDNNGWLSEPAMREAPAASPEPAVARRVLRHFAEVPALAAEQRDLKLKHEIETFVRLVRFEPPHLEIGLEAGAPPGLVQEIGTRLSEWTGMRWIVVLSREQGDLPLRAQRETVAKPICGKCRLNQRSSRTPSSSASTVNWRTLSLMRRLA